MNRRRGSVLILVTVIVFAIAFMVLALGKQVRTSALAANNDVAAARADAAARGAEQYVLALLTDYRDTLSDLTETDFSAVPVGNAYFWVIRPDCGDSTVNTWGLVDESGKLPLNTATQEQLLGLPGVTDEIAGAIIDWRDTDDTVVTNGAESTTYSQYGYGAKNSDFETVDELMLVNGMTHDILYGPPPGQAAPGQTPAADASGTSDWYLTHGIADYFTAWSTQPDTAADGTTRLSLLDTTKRQDLRSFMVDKFGNSRGNGIMDSIGDGALETKSVLGFAVQTGLQADEFTQIEDYVTAVDQTASGTTVKGKVNINTAPREVLVAMGVLSEADVDALIEARPAGVAQYPNSMAWVYELFKNKANTIAAMADLFCARGRQYSADIVAASGDGRGFRHVKIVVDTTSTPPRIVYRRDLTENGWPMDPQILANLKSGKNPDGSATNKTSTVGTGAR